MMKSTQEPIRNEPFRSPSDDLSIVPPDQDVGEEGFGRARERKGNGSSSTEMTATTKKSGTLTKEVGGNNAPP